MPAPSPGSKFNRQGGSNLDRRQQQFSRGTIVLAARGSIGNPRLPDQSAFTSTQTTIALRAGAGFDCRYLKHFLGSIPWADVTSGAAIPMLTIGKLGELSIPIAPAAEQRRIADELDTVLARVDAVNDRLARVTPLLKRFRQSVLEAAMSGRLTRAWRDENAIPDSWEQVVLSEIADVQGGITKDSKKQDAADEEVPYLRVANVQRGFLDLTEVKSIRVPAPKLASLLLAPGDVLFNEGGDLDKLGRGWIWEGQIARCTFQNHVFRARLNRPGIQPKFVSWWGNSRGLNYFLSVGKQTTNLASINKTMLCNLPLALPGAEEQAEIVRRVELLFEYADRLEARLQAANAAAERLTPALLAKAFRGELVPQDPNDEPASELLKRLAAQREHGGANSARPRGRRPAASTS